MQYILGNWNVRTLNKPGAQTALLQELKRYKLMITALQETRWLWKGARDTKTHTILYSGKEQGSKECVVAFVVDNDFKSKIIDFQAVSERICKLRICTHFFSLIMINIHCPTEEQEQHTKESFYQQLEIVYDNALRNDIKIIMSDINAKIGKEPQFYGTTGKNLLHNEMSKNGEFLINFATSKIMVISSTCFPHENIHKMILPDRTTTNQIDHVLINKKAASTISNHAMAVNMGPKRNNQKQTRHIQKENTEENTRTCEEKRNFQKSIKQQALSTL
ncbi:uncharacterized protein [Diabrotica undecimpunctata]|uniref:uncharacterized protein n=1 Tax=Diabrotica undecimpunctata TaxID=50387 RepID=UPI003B63D3FB